MNKLKGSSNRNSGKSKFWKDPKWIHSDVDLLDGHVTYLVKFLGKTEASAAKGIEVVKESIQILKFTNQQKISEGGKLPKVELTISVDGVAIQDLKAKKKKYQYPLHQISYCADDKSDKKLFCFIAKEPNSDRHSSFVFASDKQAEEITVTIGQAFELAFRRFQESSGKELEIQRRIMILQKKAHDLEVENKRLREEISSLQKKSKKNKNVLFQKDNMPGQNDTCLPSIQPPPSFHRQRNNVQQNLLEDLAEEPKAMEKPSTYFEDIKELEYVYNEMYDKYQPIAQLPLENDPFGMGNFGFTDFQEKDFQSAIGEVDRKLLEMRKCKFYSHLMCEEQVQHLVLDKDGFQRGLSFGNDSFSSEYFETTSK